MRAVIMAMLIIMATLVVVACGGGSPTTPTPPPLAQPELAAVGNAVVAGECPDGQCSYTFMLVNRGLGCGVNVKGTLALVANNAVLASDEWALPASRVVRAGEQLEVGDCCVPEAAADAATSVRVNAQGEAVACQ